MWRGVVGQVVGRVFAAPQDSVLMMVGARSYLRLIDSCIMQLKAQGPCRTCNESKEEEEGAREAGLGVC